MSDQSITAAEPLAQSLPARSPGSIQADDNACPVCHGLKVEVVEGKGARPCPPCTQAARVARLEKEIPTIHQHVKWQTLAPDVQRFSSAENGQAYIAMQRRIIDQVKSRPDSNFFLYGQTGTGKTAIAYALYRRAVGDGRPAYAFSLADYLDQAQVEIRTGEPTRLLMDLRGLKTCSKQGFVFVDELSSPGRSATAFAADSLRELMDQVISWGPVGRRHQLVVTSNYDPDRLAEYWSQQNPASGTAAIRRALEDALCLAFYP